MVCLRKDIEDERKAHPADGNEGLFSSLFKKITGKVKKDDDVTEEEIMDMVNERP